MKLLSIVIPTYNMENYLARCLQSVICGNENRDDLEVLVINDGSKDNSLSIANDFQNKYPNIIRVIDKENGNYGSCVNRGIKEASGKYFRILDADDTFSENAVCELLKALDACDDDMVVTNYRYLYDLTGEVKLVKPIGITFGKTYEEFDFSKDNYDILSMHAITYKTSLLREIGLCLDEGVSYTDLEYVFFPQKALKSLRFLNLDLYEYHIGREGQTVDQKSQVKSIKSLLVVTKRLVDDFVVGFSDKNQALLNNEKITINKIVYATFKIALFYCKKNPEYDAILKDVYKKLISTDAGTIWMKKSKIKPFVILWYLTGIYVSSLKF